MHFHTKLLWPIPIHLSDYASKNYYFLKSHDVSLVTMQSLLMHWHIEAKELFVRKLIWSLTSKNTGIYIVLLLTIWSDNEHYVMAKCDSKINTKYKGIILSYLLPYLPVIFELLCV